MIARYYNEANNPPIRVAPDGTPEYGYLSGVPLRDLTEEEFNALPKHIQASVDASPLYRRTKPQRRKVASTPDDVMTNDPAADELAVIQEDEATDGN